MTTYEGFVQVRERIAAEMGRDSAQVTFDDVWNRLERENEMAVLTTAAMLDAMNSGDSYVAGFGPISLRFTFSAQTGFDIVQIIAGSRKAWHYQTSIGAAGRIAALTDSDTRWTKEYVDPYPALTAFAASITPDDEAAMRAAAVEVAANSLTPTERDALHQLCGWDYASGVTAFELGTIAGADGMPLVTLRDTLNDLAARGLVERLGPFMAKYTTTKAGREVEAVAQATYAAEMRKAAKQAMEDAYRTH